MRKENELKVIAVVPIFNETKTLKNILERIRPHVDMFVCVDDGSIDDSLTILRKFASKKINVFIVPLKKNSGMAGALKCGFLFTLFLRKNKVIQDEDIVITIDADGQHKPEYIPEIVGYMKRKKMDVVLTRRDFSLYPTYKILGNKFLTWTNSILSGMKYIDVESGLRFLKVKTLEPILKYYTGAKYSCAQEIALISARSGFQIDNDFEVDIAYYRPGTTIWDGFIVLFLSFLAYGKWILKIRSQVNCDLPLLEESFIRSKKLWPKSAKRQRK